MECLAPGWLGWLIYARFSRIAWFYYPYQCDCMRYGRGHYIRSTSVKTGSTGVDGIDEGASLTLAYFFTRPLWHVQWDMAGGFPERSVNCAAPKTKLIDPISVLRFPFTRVCDTRHTCSLCARNGSAICCPAPQLIAWTAAVGVDHRSRRRWLIGSNFIGHYTWGLPLPLGMKRNSFFCR